MQHLRLSILLIHASDCRSLNFVLQFSENVVSILQQILPSLYWFALIWQTFAPHLHHVVQILLPLLLVYVIFALLNNKVLNALIALQNLLKHDIVLVLDRVDVLGQEFGDVFHAQVRHQLAILAKLFPIVIACTIVQIDLTA